jgi:malate dehydrogenase (oxaloacetate-decarboxylating)(NADP+)
VITRERALACHARGGWGRPKVAWTEPRENQEDLAPTHSPGVVETWRETSGDPSTRFEYNAERRPLRLPGNATAALAVGESGALAGKPLTQCRALRVRVLRNT